MAEEKKKDQLTGQAAGQAEAPPPIVPELPEDAPQDPFALELSEDTDFSNVIQFPFEESSDYFGDIEGPIEADDFKPMPKQSAVGSFLLEGLGYDVLDEAISESFKELQTIQFDIAEQEEKKEEALRMKIAGLGEEPNLESFIADVKKDFVESAKPRTIGAIYVDKKFPSLPPVMKTAISAGIDIRLAHNRNMDAMANLVEANTIREATEFSLGGWLVQVPKTIRDDLKKLSKAVLHTPLDIPGIALSTTVGVATRDLEIIHPEANERFDRLGESVKKDWERRKRINKRNEENYGQVLGGLLNVVETAGDLAWSGVHLNTRVAAAVNPDDPEFAKFETLGDWLNWISLIPVNPDAEIDFAKIWDAYMQDGDLLELHAQMEARYGEDWGWRFTAFMLKEVGVDAAIYAAGMTFAPFKAIIEAGKGARFFSAARAKSIMARASLIGVGGGLVQAQMNKSAEYDSELTFEVLSRVGGFAAGETLMAGVGAVTRGIFKNKFTKIAANVATEAGVSLLSKHATRLASRLNPKLPHLVTLLRQATLFAETQEIRRAARFVARGIMESIDSPENAALRKRLAQMTGLEEEQIATQVVAAQHIFKNVFKKPELEKARLASRSIQKAIGKKEAEDKRLTNTIAKIERRLEKGYKDKKLEARRREQVLDLKEKQSSLRSEIEESTKALSEKESEIVGLESLGVSSGSDLADMVAMSEAVGFRTMLQDVMERQQLTNEMIWANIDLIQEINFRQPIYHLDPNTGKLIFKDKLGKKLTSDLRNRAFALFRWFGEPDHVLPIKSLAKDFFDAWLRKTRWQKFIRKSWQEAERGLVPEERTAIYRTLQKGQELETIFTPYDLEHYHGFNTTMIDAYYAMRRVLDMGHLSMDIVVTRGLQKEVLQSGRKAVQVLPDGRMVRIADSVQHGLTKEQVENGIVKYKVIPRGSHEAEEEGFMRAVELRPLVSAVPVERGYIPRVYKDANYHVTAVDLKNGGMSRIGAFPTRAEAIAFRRAEEAKLGDAARHTFLFEDKWDNIGSRTTVSFPRKGIRMLDIAEEADVEQLRRVLMGNIQDLQRRVNAGVADPSEALRLEQIKVFIDNLDGTTLRGRHISPRGQHLRTTPGKGITKEGKRGGDLAPLAMTEESIREYLNSVATRAGLSDFRRHAQETFMSIYGAGGPKPVFDKLARWDDHIDTGRLLNDVRNSNRMNALEAKQMQDWLKRITRGQTHLETQWANQVNAVIAKWADSDSPAFQAMSKAFDNFVPELKSFINSMRLTGAATKLLLFNVGQILVQGSQTAGSLGSRAFTRPHLIPLAIKDTLEAIAAHSLDAERVGMSKHMRVLLEAHRRSGYFSELTTNDVVELMGMRGPTYARYRDYYSTLGATIRKARDAAQATNRKIFFWGAAPFKAGEGLNRLIAFNITRREMIGMAKRGTLKGLDRETFKGTIDDAEFLQLVTDKAKKTALDMARPGELQAMSGLGAVGFQFKQVLPKAGHMMFTTNALSGREKFGAMAAMLATWGPTSIPFLYDFWTLSEDAYFDLFTDGEPTQKDIASRWAREYATDLLDYIMASSPEFFEEMGVDRKFFVRLARKGGVNALTDGEIDIVNRVGLGKFLNETAEVFHWEDAIVFSSVVSDMYRSFINGRAGSPSIFTALERYHDAELTAPQARLQALAAVGRTVSSAGYFARFWEASDPQNFDPMYHAWGEGEPMIRSSSGRNTGILARDPNRGELWGVNLGNNRLVQFLFGITPGPVVNEIQAQKLRGEYNRAIFRYVDEQSRRYKQARTPEAKSKIQAETITELYDTLHLVTNLGFDDLSIVKQKNWIHRQVFGKFLTDEFKFLNPELFGEQ